MREDTVPDEALGTPAAAGRTVRPADEEAALLQAARTDPQAFGVLYDRYVDAVYRYTYGQTRSHEAAEDLTSLTFLRVIERLDRFQSGRPFAPWLFRIAHNAVVDYHRATWRGGPSALGGRQIQDQRAADAAESLDDREAFLSLTSGLPRDQRAALALRFMADLSVEQTATALRRSVGATKMLVARAIAALRARRIPAREESP